MKYALKTAVAIAALSFAAAGCASAPDPSPRLLSAEASLRMAKADSATMESGRAPLEKAEIALNDAREYYMDRKTDDYTHAIRMSDAYMLLAGTRGDQLVTLLIDIPADDTSLKSFAEGWTDARDPRSGLG